MLDTGFDPVVAAPCADGLILGANVSLDLGANAISGADIGVGLAMTAGSSARNGTVSSFGVGIRVTDGSGVTTLQALTVDGNAGNGLEVTVIDPQGRVACDSLDVRNNVGHGVFVRSAPGLSNMDDETVVLATADYGFVLDKSTVSGNQGDGIHLGDVQQPADLSAQIGGPTLASDVFNNTGAGLVVMQAVMPGVDCGVSAGQPGCTGVTITNNRFRENGKAGIELRSGFLLPFDLSGLGFKQNLVVHNAMSAAGCVATQTAPQIFVRGPVGASNATCGAQTTMSGCDALSQATNNHHCVWTDASTCVVSWDLRGSLTTQACADGNRIVGYSNGAGSLDVGMRAESPSVAAPTAVDARTNYWVGAPKTTVGGGSFIVADPSCGGSGCSL